MRLGGEEKMGRKERGAGEGSRHDLAGHRKCSDGVSCVELVLPWWRGRRQLRRLDASRRRWRLQRLAGLAS